MLKQTNLSGRKLNGRNSAVVQKKCYNSKTSLGNKLKEILINKVYKSIDDVAKVEYGSTEPHLLVPAGSPLR